MISIWFLVVMKLQVSFIFIVSCSIEYVNSNKKCDVSESHRFDCLPRGSQTADRCYERGCCFHSASHPQPASPSGLSIPLCFYPSNHVTYLTQSMRMFSNSAEVNASLIQTSSYPKDVKTIKANFLSVFSTTLRIQIRDAYSERWEVPFFEGNLKRSQPSPHVKNEQQSFLKNEALFGHFVVKVSKPGQPFVFRIERSSGELLMETCGGFIYADQFLQLSMTLTSDLVYGLGERRGSLAVSTNWTLISLWNRGHVPQEHTNLYGSHPFYMSKDSEGWHGVLFLSSNAMDIVVQPAPALTWRAIGGIVDIFVFSGPDLRSVMSQYTAVIGRPSLPPYWGLGFHLCRQQYGTANHTLATMDRMRRFGIPQDVQWNDIDYAQDKRVFTTDTVKFGDQRGLAEDIHSRGMYYVIIVDCGISNTARPGRYPPYDEGNRLNIFIRDLDGRPLVGRVWPGTTVWPDFTHPKSGNYWTHLSQDFHNKVPFDGMWLDMNEITSFTDGSIHGCDLQNRLDNPPYVPGIADRQLFNHTLCPHAQQAMSSHYNIHNLYGYLEANISFHAMQKTRGKRAFVISRSTFVGQGSISGHWSGDNSASWDDMAWSVTAMLQMNLLGVPLTGSDICGFNGNATQEMCTRWHQLGAFYVFSRNHNAYNCRAQDPTQFGPLSASSSSRALHVRYSLLPHLYTLMLHSHVTGTPVARPLFYEFPDDENTYKLEQQFLWGPSLLISPVLAPNVTRLPAYFPQGVWYDFYSGQGIVSKGRTVTLSAPSDVINLHLRGGHILPMQQPDLTTTLSRRRPFWLLVALDQDGSAVGDIYIDDGDSVDSYELGDYTYVKLKARSQVLWSRPEHVGYRDVMPLANVTVFGVPEMPGIVRVDGLPVMFDYMNNVLYIPSFQVITFTSSFNISWTDDVT